MKYGKGFTGNKLIVDGRKQWEMDATMIEMAIKTEEEKLKGNPKRWISPQEAITISGLTAVEISKAIGAKHFMTNGKKGKGVNGVRIDREDFVDWLLVRTKNEQVESERSVERKFDTAEHKRKQI